MSNQKIIQRAAARLAYLRNLSPDGNVMKKLKVDKGDPLVKRMIANVETVRINEFLYL